MTKILAILMAIVFAALPAVAQVASDVAASASDAGALPTAWLAPLIPMGLAALSAAAAGLSGYIQAHPGILWDTIYGVMVAGGIIDGLKTRFVLPWPFITVTLKAVAPPIGRWIEGNVTAWLDSLGKPKGGAQ